MTADSLSGQASTEETAEEIRKLYRADKRRPEKLIESYLDSRFGAMPLEERILRVEKICGRFGQPPRQPEIRTESAHESPVGLLSALLGHSAPETGATPAETLERLAGALNVIFDSLNELVSVIHSTLMGEHNELETIRHLIGSDLKRPGRYKSIQSYVQQIKEAFLIADQAFKITARKEVGKVLDELAPDRIESEAEGGLLGFKRKGELFEAYRDRFDKFRKWFESDRFSEDLSREFEKACQSLCSGKGGVK